jgi:hypothetical protein
MRYAGRERAMNKPLEDWDNAYIESVDATERTTLELKGSGCLENLGRTIGDVVRCLCIGNQGRENLFGR